MATATRPPYTATQAEARSGAQQYLDARLANNQASPPPLPSTSSTQTTAFTVPEIDISPSFSPSLSDRQAVAAQIHTACTTSGFFHITGHGIPTSAQASILSLAARFFHDLSPAQKQALHIKHSPYFRGWEPSDYTYVNPSDWTASDAGAGAGFETKEGFNWGYESGLDPTGGDGAYRELDGGVVNGNVWPDEAVLPGFYATVREYYGAVLGLARHLFRLFALSLDLDEGFFDAMMTHPGGIARLLYYPPGKKGLVEGEVDGEGKTGEIGLGAHTDYECFTILLCSSASGLEILSPENRWVPAPVVEGSLIVNVADFLMRWTNGIYKSTVHRVVNRTDKERYSVPFFYSINYDQMVETLPSCISRENPPKYGPIRAGEYILERLRATAKDG